MMIMDPNRAKNHRAKDVIQAAVVVLIAFSAPAAIAYNFTHFGGRLGRGGVDTGLAGAHDFLYSWSEPDNGTLTWRLDRAPPGGLDPGLTVADCNPACFAALKARIQPELDKWALWIRESFAEVVPPAAPDIIIRFSAAPGGGAWAFPSANVGNVLTEVTIEQDPADRPGVGGWTGAAALADFSYTILHEAGHALGVGDLYMIDHGGGDTFEGEDFCDHGLPSGPLPDPRTKADNVMQTNPWMTLDNDAIHAAEWLWGTAGADAIVTGDLQVRTPGRNANEADVHHGLTQTWMTWTYRGTVSSFTAAPKVTVFFSGIFAARNVALVGGAAGAAWVPTIFPDRVEFDAPGPYEGNFHFEIDCNQAPERHGDSEIVTALVTTDFTAVPAGGGPQLFPFDKIFGADCVEVDHKMHWAQLPDPKGWDVQATLPKILADDWLCTESGKVDEIHFWGSWREDFVGQITNIHVSIHSDIPDPDGDGPLYSMPGDLLWEQDFHPAVVRGSQPVNDPGAPGESLSHVSRRAPTPDGESARSGGAGGRACVDGQACTTDADCAPGLCVGLVCVCKCAPPGDDCFTTWCNGDSYVDFGGAGSGVPAIPADYFWPGSPPFVGRVEFGGPGGWPGDTTVQRLAEMCFSGLLPEVIGPIPTEITQLDLVSCSPLVVGGLLFDAIVSLAPGPQPASDMTVTKIDSDGGTFTSNLNVDAQVVFRPAGGGPDVGPPILLPVNLTSAAAAPWLQNDPGTFCGAVGFFPGWEMGSHPRTHACCVPVCHAGPGHPHCVQPSDCVKCPPTPGGGGFFTYVLDGQGDQGWYDPNIPYWNRPDHMLYFKYSMVDIPDPFKQRQGDIYWLDIQVTVAGPEEFGWKTTFLPFNDDAVWGDWFPWDDPNWILWSELRDPKTYESLDLAFYINGPSNMEVDEFPNTEATISIITPAGEEIVTLIGPTTVEVDISFPEDTDGDGREQVQAEIVDMELRGASSLGPVMARLRPPYMSPFERSTGEIEEKVNNTPGVLDIPPFASTGAAHSYYDVYFEIEVGGEIYHNEKPKRQEAQITEKPPKEGEKYEAPGDIPLYHEDGTISDISLSDASHTPRPKHKMHWRQLPDPYGWDVQATQPKILADDWQCSESGDVDEIHFWGSWRKDWIGHITNIHLSIHGDIPADPGCPECYSMPGDLLWERDFPPGPWPGYFTEELAGEGYQGWYDPNIPDWDLDDHTLYFKYNMVDIPEPFKQREGDIYWLDIQVTVNGPEEFGWKTTFKPFNDDAVWGDWLPGGDPNLIEWQELRDPKTDESLDLAFYINGPSNVEVDYFPESKAEVIISSPLGDDTITLTGPTTVEVDISFPDDPDANGLDQVPTEIVDMELRGTSALFGPVVARVRPIFKSPFIKSIGEIEEKVNNTPGVLELYPFVPAGVAYSYFNVYFEFELGDGTLLHNEDPKLQETQITEKPPAEGEMYEAPGVIPLYYEDGTLSDIFLADATHTPRPPKRPPDPHDTVPGLGNTQTNFGNKVIPALPADFFGPGCEPWTGDIEFQGVPQHPHDFDFVSTLIVRSDDPSSAEDPVGTIRTVDVELVALSLVSTAPISVQCGTRAMNWDVEVTLSDIAAGKGTLTATKLHPNGGTFNMTIPVNTKLTFTSTADRGNVIVLDSAIQGEPPLELTTVGAPFVNVVDPALGVVAPSDGNFVPGVEEATGQCSCNADVNGDGLLNLTDLITIQLCMQGDCSGCINSCDVNCDGLVNVADQDVYVCQAQAGWPDPTCCLGSGRRAHAVVEHSVAVIQPATPILTVAELQSYSPQLPY